MVNVHKHTVRNRLRRVEELINRPTITRRTERQVAVRLYRVLRAARVPIYFVRIKMTEVSETWTAANCA